MVDQEIFRAFVFSLDLIIEGEFFWWGDLEICGSFCSLEKLGGFFSQLGRIVACVFVFLTKFVVSFTKHYREFFGNRKF